MIKENFEVYFCDYGKIYISGFCIIKPVQWSLNWLNNFTQERINKMELCWFLPVAPFTNMDWL